MEAITPSRNVGLQVREIRRRRGHWGQRKLVDRLAEVRGEAPATPNPPDLTERVKLYGDRLAKAATAIINEMVAGTWVPISDPWRLELELRNARKAVRGIGGEVHPIVPDEPRKRKWSQTRLAKVERGEQTPTLEDVFELSLALDVSPLHLIASTWWTEGPVALRVTRPLSDGKAQDFLPADVRQWIRGVKPLLQWGDYQTDEDWTTGQRFYLVSQSLGEWRRIKEAGEYADQVRQSLAVLASSKEADADGE